MAQVYKANSLALMLQSQLITRGYAGATLSYDATTGAPVVTYQAGNGSAGQVNAVYLIKEQPSTPTEGTTLNGVAPFQFAPVQIQLCTEANPTGGAGADILNNQQVADFLGSAMVYGAKFLWYTSANGVAPTAGAMIAGNLKAQFFADPIWAGQSST